MIPIEVRHSRLFPLLVVLACSAPSPHFETRRGENHNRYGSAAFREGDLASASRHFELALEHARTRSDVRRQVDSLNNLGIVNETLGEADAALWFYDQALSLAEPEGRSPDPFAQRYDLGVFSASINRSRLFLNRGDIAAAASALELASGAASEIGSRVTRAACQKQRALLEQKSGNLALGLYYAREAERLYEICDSTPENLAGLADARLVLGKLLEDTGKPIEAIAKYREVADLGSSISDGGLAAIAQEAIADTLVGLGHLEDARLRYQLALDANRKLQDHRRARRNVLSMRQIAERLLRRDLVLKCDELLEEIASEQQTP